MSATAPVSDDYADPENEALANNNAVGGAAGASRGKQADDANRHENGTGENENNTEEREEFNGPDDDATDVSNVDKDPVEDTNKAKHKPEYWSPHAMDCFITVRKEIDDAVKYQGQGRTGRYKGEFPHNYKMLVLPSRDVLAFPLRTKSSLDTTLLYLTY